MRVVEVRFWNTVFTSFIEHVVMKLGEAMIAAGRGSRTAASGSKTVDTAGDDAVSAGTQREIIARRRMRSRLNPTSPVYWALSVLTRLMELDVILLGHLRTGPYYVLAEKV
jgi:hypothetical protein